jgi:hypothetical protein
LWRKFVELTGVVFGQSIEDLPSFGSQFQYDPAPVVFILLPRYEPRFFASLTEFDDGIVTEAEPLGSVTDRSQHSIWSTGHLKKQLMLLRLEIESRRRLLAEMKKESQLMSEIGKELNPDSGLGFHGNSHELIISCYDINENTHSTKAANTGQIYGFSR